MKEHLKISTLIKDDSAGWKRVIFRDVFIHLYALYPPKKLKHYKDLFKSKLTD